MKNTWIEFMKDIFTEWTLTLMKNSNAMTSTMARTPSFPSSKQNAPTELMAATRNALLRSNVKAFNVDLQKFPPYIAG